MTKHQEIEVCIVNLQTVNSLDNMSTLWNICLLLTLNSCLCILGHISSIAKIIILSTQKKKKKKQQKTRTSSKSIVERLLVWVVYTISPSTSMFRAITALQGWPSCRLQSNTCVWDGREGGDGSLLEPFSHRGGRTRPVKRGLLWSNTLFSALWKQPATSYHLLSHTQWMKLYRGSLWVDGWRGGRWARYLGGEGAVNEPRYIHQWKLLASPTGRAEKREATSN